MEERLGQKLVDAQVGGVGGGGASLTPVARDYIQRWHTFSSGLTDVVQTTSSLRSILNRRHC